MRYGYVLVLVSLLSISSAEADSLIITNPASSPCEDYYGSLCYTNTTFQGLVARVDLGGGYLVTEGTKLCFTIPSQLVHSVITGLSFVYQGTGDPSGSGYAGSGPMLMRSYIPTTPCFPACGQAGTNCSQCQGATLYANVTASSGTHMVTISTAVNDLQQVINSGGSCFCICLSPGAAPDYEVALASMQLSVEYQPPTPTPTVTPSPTVTFTPTITLTPTPAPVPAVSGTASLMLIIMVSVFVFRGIQRQKKL